MLQSTRAMPCSSPTKTRNQSLGMTRGTKKRQHARVPNSLSALRNERTTTQKVLTEEKNEKTKETMQRSNKTLQTHTHINTSYKFPHDNTAAPSKGPHHPCLTPSLHSPPA
jgi:hypothetical protein